MRQDEEPGSAAQPHDDTRPAAGSGPGHTESGTDTGEGSEKKGLSPIAWVGIGCGGLAVLFFAGCLVAGYMGMAWIDGIVGEFADNPAMASAKMVVRTNPELELVSSDDEAGTLTIRNRETGEILTVDLEQIEQGRIRFETSDQDGETQYRIGSGSDEDIPDWVPRYPGVAPTGTSLMQSGGEISGGFSLETDDSVDDVISYYREALETAGFTETAHTTSQSGGTRNANLVAESGDRQVTVTATSDDGATQVVVAFSESP